MTSKKQILKTNKKDHARTLCTAKEEDYVSQTPSTITRILLDFIIHDYANVISLLVAKYCCIWLAKIAKYEGIYGVP